MKIRKASLSITEKTGKFQSKTRKSHKAGTSMIEHGFSGLAHRTAKDQATHIVHPDCRREEMEGDWCESTGPRGLCFLKITTNPKIHLACISLCKLALCGPMLGRVPTYNFQFASFRALR